MDNIEKIYFLLNELYDRSIDNKNDASNFSNSKNEKSQDEVFVDEKINEMNKNINKEVEASDDEMSINESINNLLINEKVEPEKKERYWNKKYLPYSYYISKISSNPRLYLYKAAKAESLEIYKISPKKLSTLITQLDIFLLQNIKPADLLTSEITYLKNKNTGLINYIYELLKDKKFHSYFLKVLKYLLKKENYNSADCIKKAFLRHKLEKKILDKLVFYNIKNYEKNVHTDSKKEIPLFDVLIKDLEDAKNNKNHDEASIRFCNIVEMLLVLQNKKIKINKKREHFLLYKIFINMDNKEVKQTKVCDDYLFIFL
ncbi:uncharacterized protein VNE69_03265 [Vairimorpha necatrix]|uniref:Uncharacterized protein n=1 Tax=Vairimorpha necatrix TaxID=6039 RepID=A0AAX4JAR9_9MICR